MKQYNVAIIGATGLVGQELIKILEERNFPAIHFVFMPPTTTRAKNSS